MMKKLLVLLMAILILGACARPLIRENIPPPPSQGAIWVYGHYDSQGKWIPGRWIK